jgi:hypothetical protein
MANDNPAPQADDKSVDENQEGLSQVEQDALGAFVGDVKGAVTDNENVPEVEVKEGSEEKEGEDKKDVETEDETEVDEKEKPEAEKTESDKDETEVPAKETEDKSTEVKLPEVAPEKDEAGVYKEPTIEDPGDFKPGDYSFSITTTDGKTHNFATPADLDAFATTLDDNPELISASQFSLFNRKSALMEQGIASDKKEFDANKEKFDAEQNLQTTRNNMITQWNKEINYLAKSGDIPEISDENNKADWADPEVAKDPAVVARLALFKWMETENNKRMDAGLEPMKSILDAHNAMQLESMRGQEKKVADKAKEVRRAKGAMVAGPTSHISEEQPKDSIVGTGGSLDDLVAEYYNS